MFTVEIAGIPIGIDNNTGTVELVCKDYITDKEPLFTVAAPLEDVLAEVKAGEGISMAYAEQLCIFRKIALAMIDHDGFLMHSAVVDVDGEGLAFAAQSGTGKTTRVLLWQKSFGERVKIVNGDKPILRFVDGQLYAYGTPWMGKENWGSNTRVPLKYVCFLERAEDVSLTRLNTRGIVPRLFKQVLIPQDEERADRFMALLERFVGEAGFYLLKCNKDKEDPKAIWEQMKRDAEGAKCV